MADITITIDPPSTNSVTVTQGLVAHNTSHAPGGSDSLASWYATQQDILDVSGQITFPSNVVFTTGDQAIGGVKNFSSRPTVNGTGILLSGEASVANTGYLTGYVSKTETGSFLSSSQTGVLTGSFYPLGANPSGYVIGAVVRPSNTGVFVDTNSDQIISGKKTIYNTIIGSGHVTGSSSSSTITILGGGLNYGNGQYSTILGGGNNSGNGSRSLVIGGVQNSAIGSHVTVINGEQNSGTSNFATIIGGRRNLARRNSVILGGEDNFATGTGIYIFGSTNTGFHSESYIFGNNNLASGDHGLIFGSNNQVLHNNAAVISLATSQVSSGDNTLVVNFDSGIHLKGQTFFNSRPQISGVGIQTTGEYPRFNVWDDFSGALYPYPKNDLNRSWNTLKRLENAAGTSGETIWYNIPQWTGETPVGTGVSSFYNTGFWARQYDWSCVAFEGGRTFSGSPTTSAVLISPRHILSTNHSNIQSGTRYAFVSNKQTGFTWEAEVQSVARTSGDTVVAILSQDAPSQIVPASIIGSPPTPSWESLSLVFVRALTVKNSTVLFDYLGPIATGAGFQSGSLIIDHYPDPGARFTGQHEGGDSNSPVFIPLDDGRLALVGVASTVSSLAFVGDPAIQSGIASATSGYSVDTYNVLSAQSTSILPVSGQLSKFGSLTSPWTEVYAGTISGTTIIANALVGATSKLNLGNNYLAYNGNRTVSSGSKNLSFAPRTDSVITLSGSFPVTTMFDVVITGSSVVTFSGLDTTLILPHGSGFSGSGSIIDVRSVGTNTLMVSNSALPTNTGYLTGYAPIADSITGISVDGSSTKTITLYQQDGSTLSASFTDQQGTGGVGSDYYIYSGSFNAADGNLTLNRTGDTGTVVIPLDGRYITGSVVRPSETGSFLTSGQTGNFITSSQTGVFYPTSNPSGYITISDLSPYSTIVSTTGISGHLQSQITANNATGAFLTTGAADSRYALQSSTGAYTGEFYPRSSNPSNYLVAADLSTYATQAYVTGASGHLQGQITNLNAATGNYVTGSIVRPSETGNFVTVSQTGQFYAASNPNGYITNSSLTPTGAFLTTGAGDTRYITQSNSGLFVPYNGATGDLNLGLNGLSVHRVKSDSSDGLLITSSNGSTGIVVGAGGGSNVTVYGGLKLDYSTVSKVPIIDGAKNLISSDVTTGELNYLTGVASPIQGQFLAITNNTGNFVTSSQTGSFVTGTVIRQSETGAFLTTGAADSRYSRIPYVSEVYIDAGAMLTGVSGATPATVAVSTSGIYYDTYQFDPAVTGFAQFKVKLADYNLGNMRAKFDWTTSGTGGSVVWGIQGLAVGNGESLASAWSTGIEIADTFITGTGHHTTDSTSPFAPTGAIQSGDMLYFRIYRSVANASDTLALNASLLGVSLQYTGNLVTAW